MHWMCKHKLILAFMLLVACVSLGFSGQAHAKYVGAELLHPNCISGENPLTDYLRTAPSDSGYNYTQSCRGHTGAGGEIKIDNFAVKFKFNPAASSSAQAASIMAAANIYFFGCAPCITSAGAAAAAIAIGSLFVGEESMWLEVGQYDNIWTTGFKLEREGDVACLYAYPLGMFPITVDDKPTLPGYAPDESDGAEDHCYFLPPPRVMMEPPKTPSFFSPVCTHYCNPVDLDGPDGPLEAESLCLSKVDNPFIGVVIQCITETMDNLLYMEDPVTGYTMFGGVQERLKMLLRAVLALYVILTGYMFILGKRWSPGDYLWMVLKFGLVFYFAGNVGMLELKPKLDNFSSGVSLLFMEATFGTDAEYADALDKLEIAEDNLSRAKHDLKGARMDIKNIQQGVSISQAAWQEMVGCMYNVENVEPWEASCDPLVTCAYQESLGVETPAPCDPTGTVSFAGKSPQEILFYLRSVGLSYLPIIYNNQTDAQWAADPEFDDLSPNFTPSCSKYLEVQGSPLPGCPQEVVCIYEIQNELPMANCDNSIVNADNYLPLKESTDLVAYTRSLLNDLEARRDEDAGNEEAEIDSVDLPAYINAYDIALDAQIKAKAYVGSFGYNYCDYSNEMYGDDGTSNILNDFYPSGKERVRDVTFMRLWDILDCKLGKYIGVGDYEDGGLIPQVILVAIALLFTNAFGIPIFILAMVFFVFILTITIRVVHVFIIAFIGLAILVYISPLVIPMVLFNFTKSGFNGWLQQVIAYVLQPIIMFAFLAFVFALVDQIMFGDNKHFYPINYPFGEVGFSEDMAITSEVQHYMSRRNKIIKEPAPENPSVRICPDEDTIGCIFQSISDRYSRTPDILLGDDFRFLVVNTSTHEGKVLFIGFLKLFVVCFVIQSVLGMIEKMATTLTNAAGGGPTGVSKAPVPSPMGTAGNAAGAIAGMAELTAKVAGGVGNMIAKPGKDGESTKRTTVEDKNIDDKLMTDEERELKNQFDGVEFEDEQDREDAEAAYKGFKMFDDDGDGITDDESDAPYLNDIMEGKFDEEEESDVPYLDDIMEGRYDDQHDYDSDVPHYDDIFDEDGAGDSGSSASGDDYSSSTYDMGGSDGGSDAPHLNDIMDGKYDEDNGSSSSGGGGDGAPTASRSGAATKLDGPTPGGGGDSEA